MSSFGRAFVFAAALSAVPAFAQTGARSSTPLIPGGDSKAPVSINADKLEYFDKEKKLVYSGDVLAKQGAATLKASTLVILLAGADTPANTKAGAGALPTGGSQDVRHMDAAGPVTVTQNDEVGLGDRAEYDKAANKVYLYGHVSLSQGANITKGDKLTYDLTTSQAQVEGGRVMSIFTPGSGDPDASKDRPGKNLAAAKPVGKPRAAESRGPVAQPKDAR